MKVCCMEQWISDSELHSEMPFGLTHFANFTVCSDSFHVPNPAKHMTLQTKLSILQLRNIY